MNIETIARGLETSGRQDQRANCKDHIKQPDLSPNRTDLLGIGGWGDRL